MVPGAPRAKMHQAWTKSGPAPLDASPGPVGYTLRANHPFLRVVLISGQMQPIEIKVRLMLRSDRRMDVAELSRTRHMLAAWLAGDGSLVLPEEPDLTYCDCVVTEGVTWDELMEDGAAR